MYITSLDKKLCIVKQVLTKEQLAGLNISQEEFENLIKNQIYGKAIESLLQRIRIYQRQTEIGLEWELRSFMLTELEMFTLLKEISEMNPEDLKEISNDMNKFLGIKG